jgi:hypothetical protein
MELIEIAAPTMQLRMSQQLAHRDESDSRLTCLKSGTSGTLVRSTIDANETHSDHRDAFAERAVMECQRTAASLL